MSFRFQEAYFISIFSIRIEHYLTLLKIFKCKEINGTYDVLDDKNQDIYKSKCNKNKDSNCIYVNWICAENLL